MRLIASNVFGSASLDLLQGRSGPKERPLMVADDSGAAWLNWDTLPDLVQPVTLDLVIAAELGRRETGLLTISIDGESEPLATQQVWCVDAYQRLSIPLPADRLRGRRTLRLTIRTSPGDPHCFFAPDSCADGGLEMHGPAFSVGRDEAGDFCSALCSLASLQAFSWKQGCVLDGLAALHATGHYPAARPAMLAHLEYFGFSAGRLEYETPRSQRIVDQLTTIEATLPFAHVAMIDPNHPWVDLAMRFWKHLLDKSGSLIDGTMTSSEGAYTVAYPMVLIATLRNEPAWIEQAIRLLYETYDRLVQPDGIYLRHWTDGRRLYRNWARGIGWLLLGHAQTLRYLANPPERLLMQFRTLASRAMDHQHKSGLWAAFVDEPVLPDSAGSAGIAAALRIGASIGYLPDAASASASACEVALRQRLTPDGFLDGCTQSNKAGESLQRSDYRVVTPYATGLLALLHAGNRLGLSH